MATRIIPTWLIGATLFGVGILTSGIAFGQECQQTAAEVRAIALQAGRSIEVGYPKYGTDAFDQVLVIDHGIMTIPGYQPTPITVLIHIKDDCVLGAIRLPRPAAQVRAFLHAQQQEA